MVRRALLYSLTALVSVALTLAQPAVAAAQVQTPEQFFGFKIGADGELARYPKVLEYMQHLAKSTDRVKYEELGKATMGTPYALVTISSPANLARMSRLVGINRRLSDPRGLSEADATKLIAEGRPFYLLFATIHSTELGNGQAIIEVAHRLATDRSGPIREILDNAVLLLVPSQNPDGQNLVIDHWYKTKGTPYSRNYPDLYHKYVGHDDNRDWFMFTQQETRLAIEKVQNAYRPQVVHDMHQQGATGSRIFVPPFSDPYDRNIHPIIAQGQFTIGLAMASQLVAEGKAGVEWSSRYDMWTPARQYMVYHGAPRILTEIASVNLADPYINPAGKDRGLGPQEPAANYPIPYRSGEWRFRQIVDYAVSVAFAGLTNVAKYHDTWLENFYRVQRDWVNRTAGPYAFVVPAAQRDPYGTYEMLQTLKFGDVEIHRARAAFTAGGKPYPAGSYVIKVAQPFGAFAKTMLEKQIYPDLRLFPGGPPLPPYDVTGHTLWMLLGVTVDTVEQKFDADLELLPAIEPMPSAAPARPKWAYVMGPESNAPFLALTPLQKANVPVFRAATAFDLGGRTFAPGSWIVPASAPAAKILEETAKKTGVAVAGADKPIAVDAYQVKPNTRIGLWRAANNMPAGWAWWLFEQYGFNHQVISSLDFAGELSAKYDTIVLPSGTSRASIVNGLNPKQHDPKEWEWAFGVGEAGWTKLAEWVKKGGTLVAIGSAVETARELLDLPIEKVLPETRRRFGLGQQAAQGPAQVPATEVTRILRSAFQSPAQLIDTLQERVVEPTSQFYCPGSLLQNEFNPSHPVAWGMPEAWPIFFESNQAYRIKPGFSITAETVSRYPQQGPILMSGWLLGEDLLRDMANIVAFKVGQGYVVTLASEVDYRTQPRATFKLVFNSMFHGPSTKVAAGQLGKAVTVK
jgi:hypothetical protein